MNSIAASSSTDREDLFRDTIEIHQHIHEASLIEKDFWVCWVLSRLFSLEIPVSLLFKGGTSLSKAYSVIHRLSEDIDLSINRYDLGFSDESASSSALSNLSNKERTRKLEQIKNECTSYIARELLIKLRDDFSEILGMSVNDNKWSLEIDPEEDQTLLLTYPATSVTSALADYVSSNIKMEFGARSDHWPNEARTITPYAAEVFPESFEQSTCTVITLRVERTFWEKAIILHKTYHGGEGRLRPRMVRHYYDFFMLANTHYAEGAIAQSNILDAVAEHAGVFFPQAWRNMMKLNQVP